jgi:hypothetical protein
MARVPPLDASTQTPCWRDETVSREYALLQFQVGPMPQVLERGNIYFVYRPRVEQVSAAGIEDIQRFFIVLSPRGKHLHRLIVIGRKRLPDMGDEHERNWGFVQKVVRNPRELEDELGRVVYETKTRGERHLAPARPAGEGVYAILKHDNHTHLAFALELPEMPGEVQEELNIPEQGSYIITIRNPAMAAPEGIGLPDEDKPELPNRLQARFRGRRFVPADPPEFLDRESTEFVLIGADEDVSDELDLRLNPEHETMETAEIFNELQLEPREHPLRPLFEGKWQ